MSFTRFHDDPVRIQKRLEESTFLGRYQLNKPGPGTKMPFFEDPNVRLQSWGANLHNNTIEFESELRGLKRPLKGSLAFSLGLLLLLDFDEIFSRCLTVILTKFTSVLVTLPVLFTTT